MDGGHDYGEETYAYGHEEDPNRSTADKVGSVAMDLAQANNDFDQTGKKGVDKSININEDSELDEEEMRDNFDPDDPPIITLQYEIKILCAKEILVRDGTQLMVQCIRGEQKAQTNTKMLKSNTVYFQQKVVMKITLEKSPGK